MKRPASSLLLFCLLALVVGRVSAGLEDEVYRGNIERYPAPIPVSTVPRAPDKAGSLLAPDAEALARPVSNGTVEVRLTDFRIAGRTRDGWLVDVGTLWRNVHPRVRVRRDALQGKADRSMGAGKLLGAGAREDPRQVFVLKDVAYLIPRWGDHVVLLADGIAVPLDASSSRLPDGADPEAQFSLSRHNERRVVRFRFRMPRGASHIALHVFDYANGHLVLPLRGGAARPASAMALGGQKTEALELAPGGAPHETHTEGIVAPLGWHFLDVDLLGRSRIRQAGQRAIVQIRASDVWLQDSAGFLYPAYGGPDEGGGKTGAKLLRFFPEYPTLAHVGFLLPRDAKPSRLLVRTGNRTLVFSWKGAAAPALPRPFAHWQDGEVAEFSLLGMSRHAGLRILDLAVTNLRQDKGLEIDTARQFRLTHKGTTLPPDTSRARLLAHAAPGRLVLAPGVGARYLLAFDDRSGEWQLEYQGMHDRHVVPLAKALPDTARGHLQQLGQPIVLPPGVRAMAGSGLTPAPEAEPNDSPEQAVEVNAGKTPIVLGRAGARQSGYDEDHYLLQIEGEPGLWEVRALGPGVERLEYLDPQGQAVSSASRSDDHELLRLTNLFLLPGKHHFRAQGRAREGGDYLLQFIPHGPPDASLEQEPNDTPGRAQPVRLGQSMRGTLTEGDEDHYGLVLDEAARLRITLRGRGVRLSVEDQSRNRRSDVHVQLGSGRRETRVEEVELPHGEYVLSVKGDEGDYRLGVEQLPPWKMATDADPGVDLAFVGPAPVWAAFDAHAQSASVSLRLANRSNRPRTVRLVSRFSRWGWRVLPEQAEVPLPAGESRTIGLRIEAPGDIPASGPVILWVGAETPEGVQATAHLEMPAVCGRPPLQPHRDSGVPDALLGGLDVAWDALGGKIVEAPDKREAARLIDGVTPAEAAPRWRWSLDGKEIPEITVNLAGQGAIPIRGFLFHPLGCRVEEMARRFEVLLSQDGKQFTRVLTGSLTDRPVEQAFVLDRARPARMARLRILDSHQDAATHGGVATACLGEWKVVAEPGFALSDQGFDVARTALGGHVVWSSPAFDADSMLKDEARSNPLMTPDKDGNVSWVFGFQHDRAARITSLVWQPRNERSDYYAPLRRVRVGFSTESPLGPWREGREWELDARSPSRLELETPVWARFVRIDAFGLDPEKRYQTPKRLVIHEQVTEQGGYRSILGEWGHYRTASAYEHDLLTQGDAQSGRNDTKGNQEHADHPRDLVADRPVAGRVRFGEDEDRYRIVVPDGMSLLELILGGDALFRLGVDLEDAEGKAVPWLEAEPEGAGMRYRAQVKAGVYRLRVRELPRSVVVAWDQSGSVADFHPLIYRAMTRFVQTIRPQAEYLNFLPFQDSPRLLLEHWTDQPLALLRALNDYDRGDSSSAAESNLIAAARALGDRQGDRVIMIITDAQSGEEKNKTEPLWKALAEARPRIFSVELHNGDGEALAGQQDRMQDWAMANHGDYVFFRSGADLDHALERALCKVRQPARYRIVARLGRLEPGTLRVGRSSRAAAAAMELIIDASGSMYKKQPDGRTRIAVAREAVANVLEHSIPAGTPVALRVYGHRQARSCRTDLEVRLAPLDPKKMNAIVQGLKPKDRSRTPLAASLSKVASDLRHAKGRKLVLLFTDGEESCNGDPEKAIRELRRKMPDVEINIIGFAIKSKRTKRDFENWARLGNGRYFDARDADELDTAMEAAVNPAFEVLDAEGSVIARGTVGKAAVTLPPGHYDVRIRTVPPIVVRNVTIQPGKESSITPE